MSFSLANLDLRYEPFPIGVARPIMADATYQAYLDQYPPIELFEYIPKVGNKYCLSEKYNPAKYQEWIKEHECWREFHRWVKSPDFVFLVLDELAKRSVDLGFKRRSTAQQVQRRLRALLEGRWWQGEDRLSARFEYSMLPADGGSVTPHTDNPDKIITMVVSMARPGEWDQAYGGGTEVNRHRRPELQLQPCQRQGRVRGHGAAGCLRVRAQPVRGLRQDLQLLALRASDAGPRLEGDAAQPDHQYRARSLRSRPNSSLR